MAVHTFLLLVAAVVAPPTPVTSIHAPDVDARLGYLVGDWTIEGLNSKVFRQRCSWYGARSFVICSSTDQRDGTIGQTTFGYSELRRRYTYQRFDSAGRSINQMGFPTGRYGIVYTDERPEADGLARVQTSFNLEDEGLRYTQYRSADGHPWVRVADYRYVPAIQKRVRKARR